jgi:ribosomal protein L18E
MKSEQKNIVKKKTIDMLYKKAKEAKKDVYLAIAKELERTNKNTKNVNLLKIETLKNIDDKSIVVIPGKVLGYGNTNKKCVIYAYGFSKNVKEKLKEKAKTLIDFCNDNISYKDVVIVK